MGENKEVKKDKYDAGALCADIIIFCIATCALAGTAKFIMWLFF